MNFPFENPLPELELAVNATLRAGKEILQVYKNDFSVTFKGENDPLTEADLKSNKILLESLSKTGLAILSEEELDDKSRLKKDKLWIIDPLDGTKDFIKRNGEFSIMVALVEKGVPILGIVYQPTNGSLFVAQKGGGLFLTTCYENDKKYEWVKLNVNKFSLEGQFTAIMSRNHLSERDKNLLSDLGINKYSQKGSSGLKVGEICKGNADIYFNSSDKLKQWDSCAAYCMIVEAGGKMTDMFGKDLIYNVDVVNHKDGILVTNGEIHDVAIDKYQEICIKKE